jgi:signal peptidase I
MNPNLKISTLRELWQQTNEKHWLSVIGTSMLPLLHEGDNILISHDLYTIQRGDILVFKQADGLVAHRVVRIIKQQNDTVIYQTKGDNCSHFDTPLFDQEVLGRIDSIRKNGREYDLTTTGWQFCNKFLATCHLFLGILFQTLRYIKHSIHI